MIDADILRYRIGFAAEHVKYRVWLRGEEALGPVRIFNSHKETIKWINEEAEYSYDKTVEVEPVSFCLHSVKETIESILNNTASTSYNLYLTGKNNFREQVATIRPYKGNRDKSHKPTHYDSITEYLTKYWNAEIIDGMEADDAIAMNRGDSTIIASIDKDLDQLPGWHYNIVKKESYFVTEEEAIRNFYTQLLSGDSTDNIQGIPGVGKKTASKWLKDCKSEKDMYAICKDKYSTFNELNENAQLLWLRRKPEDYWRPPA